MNVTGQIDLIWWITVVELPALGGLFLLVWRSRRDAQKGAEENRSESETGLSRLRENIAAYKLEVAQTYASLAAVKELERRLTRQLNRIENKLDGMSHLTGGYRS